MRPSARWVTLGWLVAACGDGGGAGTPAQDAAISADAPSTAPDEGTADARPRPDDAGGRDADSRDGGPPRDGATPPDGGPAPDFGSTPELDATQDLGLAADGPPPVDGVVPADATADARASDALPEPLDARPLDATHEDLASLPPVPGPPAPFADAVTDLEAESARPVSIAIEDGLPVFVSLQVPVPGVDPAERALAFLAAHPDLFGFAAPAEGLYPARLPGPEDEARDFVVLAQHHHGVPVLGAALSFHFEGADVTSISGRWLPEMPTPRPPEVSAAVAREGAARALSDQLSDTRTAGESTLVYVDRRLLGGEDTRVHLAWKTGVFGTRAGGAALLGFRVYTDAHDGSFLIATPNEADGDRYGEDFDIEVSPAFLAAGTPAFLWEFWRPLVNWFTEDGPTAAYPGGDAEGDAANLYLHAVYHLFFDTFSMVSWDDDGDTLRMIIHDPTAVDGFAKYSGSDETLRFSDGAVLPDVVGHEFSHGVDDHHGELNYAYQSGALDESFADVFGYLSDPDEWFLGDRDLDGDGINEAYFRDMSEPANRGHPDHMDAAVSTDGLGYRVLRGSGISAPCPDDEPRMCNDFGFVHTNSGIPNKVAYLLFAGGVHKGYAITGLGTLKTSWLYYRVLTRHMGESSRFSDARRESIEVAQAYVRRGSLGFTGGDVCDIMNAWASAGVGAGDADCDGTTDDLETDDDNDFISDARDVCPQIRDPLQEDTDGDGQGDACDRDDDNDGAQDEDDNCRLVFNDQADTDGDGIGDLCEDTDGDGVFDVVDNCPNHANPYQEAHDGDPLGDACDPDMDDDGIANAQDVCPSTADPAQRDRDRDGRGDLCDNCPNHANPDQANGDSDVLGDVCDDDNDDDGIADGVDNCPGLANPDQTDLNHDGIGLACDDVDLGVFRREIDDAVLGDLSFPDAPDAPFRVPLAPCRDDRCPNRLAPGLKLTLGLTLPPDLRAAQGNARLLARVTDEAGRVVARGKTLPDGRLVVSFRPGPRALFRTPAGVLVKGKRFFLELLPAPEVSRERSYPVSIIFTDGALPPPPPPPAAEWPRFVGSPEYEIAVSLVPAPDAGVYVIGNGFSPDSGALVGYVTRIDANGAVLWTRMLEAFGEHQARGAAPGPDGGVLMVGGAPQESHGAWAARFDPDGDLLWLRRYGGDQDRAWFNRAVATPDGFLVGGTATDAIGPQPAAECFRAAAWFVALDADGEVRWQTRLAPGEGTPEVLALSHGIRGVRAVLAANEAYTVWVVDLDANGALVAEVAHGGMLPQGAALAADGRVAIAGKHEAPGALYSGRVAVLDPTLTPLWQRDVLVDAGVEAHRVDFTTGGQIVVLGIQHTPRGRFTWQARFQGDGAPIDEWDGSRGEADGLALLATAGETWVAMPGANPQPSPHDDVRLFRTDDAAAPPACTGATGPIGGLTAPEFEPSAVSLFECEARAGAGPDGPPVVTLDTVGSTAICVP